MKAVLPVALVVVASCVRANVTVVDRRTALEMQAAGEYRALEMDLRQAGLTPAAVPLTRSELETAGTDRQASPIDAFARVHGSVKSDSELLDSLLVKQCVGEGAEGLLVATPDRCPEDQDATEVAELVARVNRDRQQMWEWMLGVRPGVDARALRERWRAARMNEVPCGGLVATADGGWTQKECR